MQSTSYSCDQSSTGTMRTLLHKKPIDPKDGKQCDTLYMVHVPEARLLQLVCMLYFVCHTHTIEYSGQSLSSTTKEFHLNWSVSESEMETENDSEQKPLEPIPEGDVKAGGESTDLSSARDVKGAEAGDVICYPDTVDGDRSGDGV